MTSQNLIGNRYKILESLGHGGIGQVLKVRDTRTGEVLALKRLATLDVHQARRFQREFRLLSALQHPHIVSVKDVGMDDGTPYFTMEYLQGITLEQVLKTPDGALCQALRTHGAMLRQVLAQICDALHSIHTRGVIHRDLKPANIFIQDGEGSPQVKLLDLGLVKFKEEFRDAQTQEGIMLGTVHYMSPEQIRGVDLDARADLYALGAVLYEVLAGRKVFEGQSAATVMFKHLQALPVPPRVFNLDVSHDLQLIALRLLEKEPDRRYQSAADLLADLSGSPPADRTGGRALPMLHNTRFLGRRKEMVAACERMDEARRGHGRGVCVSGEPGIGKTRFVSEFRANATAAGMLVVFSACFEDRTAPFQPVVEAIRGAEVFGPLADFAQDEDRAELSRLFPELRPSDNEALTSELRQEDRAVLFEALFRLLEEISHRASVLLCIDDIQWADQGSLDFFAFLKDRLEELPLCLCLSHRLMEKPPNFLAQLHAISLTPLGLEDVADLLASMFGTLSIPQDLTQEIFALSGGNPFFALEATRTLVGTGAVAWESDRWTYKGMATDFPQQIEPVLHQRVAHLNRAEQDMLACAAVINRPVDFDLFLAVHGGDEDALFGALERLVHGHFLHKDRQNHYALFHSLFADAICQGLTPEALKVFHSRIAQALLAQNGHPPVEIAHHLLLADQPQDALPHLIRAGDQAFGAYAYADARKVYEQAMQIVASGDATPENYPDLLCNYVDVLYWTGSWDNVQKYAEEGLKRQDLNASHRARLCQNLGTALTVKGQYAQVEEQLFKGLSYIEQTQDKKIHMKLEFSLIRLYWSMGKYEKATEHVQKAVNICKKFGDTYHIALSEYLLGNDHLTNCRFSEAEPAFEVALKGFKKIKEKNFFYQCEIFLREIWTYRGKYEEAISLSQRLIQMYQKQGDIRSAHETLVLGCIYVEMGKLDEAETCYFSALDTLSKANQRQKLSLVYTHLSLLCLKKNAPYKALKFAAQAEEILDAAPVRQCQVYRALGMCHAALKAPEEATGYFEKSIHAVKEIRGYQYAQSLYEFGRFLLSIGDREKAEVHLNQAVQLFGQMGADVMLKKAQAAWRDAKDVGHPAPDAAQIARPAPRAGSPEMFAMPADMSRLLDEAIDRLLRITGADRGLILTVENGKPRIQTACSRQLDESSIADISMSVVQTAIAANNLIATSDAAHDPRFQASQSIAEHNIGSILCMPLRTRNGDIIGAVYADREGATSFAPQDVAFFKSFGEFIAVALENALRYHTLQADLEKLAGMRTRFGDMVGTSQAMQRVYDLIERLATTDVTVLLQGETGTGKGLVARTLHAWSNRADQPFLLQNCGAMPRELLESELFGHCKGAYTGASEDRPGLFEAANGGTVFLDEIADAPPEVQVRLLHVLEEGVIRRIGENSERQVDVRIIAATYRDMEAEVKAGRFREDLYYRLKVMTVEIPPLRKRPEDITLLADHFLRFWQDEMKKKTAGFSPAVLTAFLNHAWPGNIRELENAVQHAVALVETGGRIDLRHLPEGFSSRRTAPVALPTGDLKTELERYEQALIVAALEKNHGNVTQTAQALGMSRYGLQKKMLKYGIESG